jgi:hypothetical protein
MSIVTNYKVNGTELGNIFLQGGTKLTGINSFYNFASSSSGQVIIGLTSSLNTVLSYSLNGGTTWLSSFLPVSGVTVGLNNTGTTWVVLGNNGNTNTVTASNNNGSSWISCTLPIYYVFPSHSITVNTSGTTIYLGSSNINNTIQLFKLTFNGTTLTETKIGPNTGGYITNVVSDTTETYIYCSLSEYPYFMYSSNSGTNWTNATIFSAQANTISCNSTGQYVILGTNNALFLSNNYGVNFTNLSNANIGLPTNTVWYSSSINSSGNIIIALTQTNLYVSNNIGTTWQKINSYTFTTDQVFISTYIISDGTYAYLSPYNSNTTNNSHNNINSNNKTFNLQIFLNETCKDAMNIMDFVDSIKIQLCDIESIGELGFVNGMSKLIIKHLNALDENMRPVHCNDPKRDSLYVKDANVWEKEGTDNKKIKKAIKYISHKNICAIPEWKAKYPDCIYSDSKKSNQYNHIVIEAMGGPGDNDDEKADKIVKKIAK